MIAFVRSVIAARASAGSMWPVSASTSTNTGVAPWSATQSGVATKLYAGTITSCPACTFAAESASWSALVPQWVMSTRFTPMYCANSSSSARVSGA